MADKVTKFLLRLSPKEREKVLAMLRKLAAGQVSNIDIKALKNQGGLFRARVGRIRVVYFQDENHFEIRRITNRNEKTYKNL